VSWFETSFPWIGLVGAVVLLVLMFGTDVLRSDTSVSRWRDLVWLSWAAAVAYLLHNVEEYGIDLWGQTYAFPGDACAIFGHLPYPDCPVPPLFFLAVNVPMFWFVGPVAALLSRRHPLVGLALYGVIFVNALVHVIAGLVTGAIYNPGWLTAVFIFLPLCAWVAYALFGENGLSYRALAFLVGWGVVVHVVLAGSVALLMRGVVSDPEPAELIQIVNAALLLLAPWLVERWRGGAILRSRTSPAMAAAGSQ
jgi:hypothetical protein